MDRTAVERSYGRRQCWVVVKGRPTPSASSELAGRQENGIPMIYIGQSMRATTHWCGLHPAGSLRSPTLMFSGHARKASQGTRRCSRSSIVENSASTICTIRNHLIGNRSTATDAEVDRLADQDFCVTVRSTYHSKTGLAVLAFGDISPARPGVVPASFPLQHHMIQRQGLQKCPGRVPIRHFGCTQMMMRRICKTIEQARDA